MDKASKIIGLAFAVGGLVLAARTFSKELDTVEKKGFTLMGGISLVLLGAALVTRFEKTADQARSLLA